MPGDAVCAATLYSLAHSRWHRLPGLNKSAIPSRSLSLSHLSVSWSLGESTWYCSTMQRLLARVYRDAPASTMATIRREIEALPLNHDNFGIPGLREVLDALASTCKNIEVS